MRVVEHGTGPRKARHEPTATGFGVVHNRLAFTYPLGKARQAWPRSPSEIILAKHPCVNESPIRLRFA